MKLEEGCLLDALCMKWLEQYNCLGTRQVGSDGKYKLFQHRAESQIIPQRHVACCRNTATFPLRGITSGNHCIALSRIKDIQAVGPDIDMRQSC